MDTDENDPQTAVEWLRTLDLPGPVEVVLAVEMEQLDRLRVENERLRDELQRRDEAWSQRFDSECPPPSNVLDQAPMQDHWTQRDD